MSQSDDFSPYSDSRRTFIVNGLKAAAGASLLSIQSFAGLQHAAKNYTVQEIMDIILKEVPGAPFSQTVDTLKSGSADQNVTGIITTMFATIDVINQAIKQNANFIIAHEPTFYNHADDKQWTKDNSVVKQKAELLEKNKITVWRFHDYCHALRPDAVSYGVAKKANWLPYYKTGERMLTVPAITLLDLAKHLKTSLGISQLRVIGDFSQKCERIALLPGAWGGQNQITTAETSKPDVMVVGELHEWETAEYIRDARSFGKNISLIVLGHSVSEEPGMEYVAEWLRPKVPGVKIKHIASGSPFVWL